jgi:hypothetical protein
MERTINMVLGLVRKMERTINMVPGLVGTVERTINSPFYCSY